MSNSSSVAFAKAGPRKNLEHKLRHASCDWPFQRTSSSQSSPIRVNKSSSSQTDSENGRAKTVRKFRKTLLGAARMLGHGNPVLIKRMDNRLRELPLRSAQPKHHSLAQECASMRAKQFLTRRDFDAAENAAGKMCVESILSQMSVGKSVWRRRMWAPISRSSRERNK